MMKGLNVVYVHLVFSMNYLK